MLTTITYVYEDGAGNTVSEEKSLPSAEFVVKVDDTGDGTADNLLGKPAVTTEIEIENDGETSTPSDQCGNVERFRTENSGWMIRVTGMVTAGDREGNLSVNDLKAVAGMDSIWIRSDLISGQFAVQNTVITQPNDLVYIQTPDTDGEEKVFEFQLQLGESQGGS